MSVVLSSILDAEQLTIVDRFTYLGNCLTKNGNTPLEVSTSITKTRAAYAELKPL